MVERTDEVPLFVEELTRAVLEKGDAKPELHDIPATLLGPDLLLRQGHPDCLLQSHAARQELILKLQIGSASRIARLQGSRES